VITGEFLVADDFGPLGRLLGRGESMVFRAGERELLVNEAKWIGGELRKADRLLTKLSALVPLREEAELDRIFEAMINWTPEAVKLGVCRARILHEIKELGEKGKTAMLVPSKFAWTSYNAVQDSIDFVRVARVQQLKKLLDHAFTDEKLKDEPDRIYRAVAMMGLSKRR
jgi:hypothetical protein